MRPGNSLWIVAAALSAVACSETAKEPAVPSPVNFETVFSSGNCGGSASAKAGPIADQEELRIVTRADAPRGFNESPPPDIPFPQPGVASLWLLAMGERSTAGYAIAVDRAESGSGKLTIVVDWQEPSPDAMTAQMITSPCVVLRLPPLQVTKMLVIDRGGITRMTWPVAAP